MVWPALKWPQQSLICVVFRTNIHIHNVYSLPEHRFGVHQVHYDKGEVRLLGSPEVAFRNAAPLVSDANSIDHRG